MRTVIRRGVFETNSSSTHSLTFTDVAPKSYTFECKSAWSRLLMFKGVLNELRLEYEWRKKDFEESDDEDTELIYDIDVSDDSFEKDLDELYDACVKVFCKEENVEPEKLVEYLSNLYIGENGGGQYDKELKKYFCEHYAKKGDGLCSMIFEEGCLFECDCYLCRGNNLHDALFKSIKYDNLEDLAKKILYGEHSFFALEKYQGVILLDKKEVI